MKASEKIPTKIHLILIFIYLSIFPLGMLLKIPVSFLGKSLSVNLADILAIVFIPIYFLGKFKKPIIYKSVVDFIYACLFSLIFSINIFKSGSELLGSLYFIRLLTYFYFFIVVWNYVSINRLTKELLLNSLIAVSSFIGVLGWVQYYFKPDLVFLKFIGWDDHLFRLAGTFLDPAFTSLFLVFGALITFINIKKRGVKSLVLFLFFLVSTIFTYARASYLALFAALIFIALKGAKKTAILVFLSIVIFSLSIFILPRRSSEGTLLERTASINARINNYKEMILVIKRFPVFGVGFNNLCEARIIIFGGNPKSHSCSGSDSSILFILATTGIVGFLIFLNMVFNILKSIDHGIYGDSFRACFAALFIHSFFVQSAFYPFVMGYFVFLTAISIKSRG